MSDIIMIKCEAYARGYYDGRVNGVEVNDLEGEYRYFYTTGYERGVADYCCFELGEEC